MTAKHTQGPWKYSFESVDNEWAIITDSYGSIVANVNSETGPDAVSAPAMRIMPVEANARLIAAAPELLAALAIAEGIVHNAVDSGKPVAVHLAMIRAAIAKATTP